jgi:hypothetical protein
MNRNGEVKMKLVFVYNADSGIFNTLTDIAHKIFAPETYSCNLCAITYGNFAVRAEWKEFIETLDVELEFLHRDELLEHYAVAGIELPAVFSKSGESLKLWLTAREINLCSSIQELKSLITCRLTAVQV